MRFGNQIEFRGFLLELSQMTAELDVSWTGSAGCCRAKCLTNGFRKLLKIFHASTVFCDRFEEGEIVDFLITMSVSFV